MLNHKETNRASMRVLWGRGVSHSTLIPHLLLINWSRRRIRARLQLQLGHNTSAFHSSPAD